MRGSGENRGASFSCPCLLAPLPFPSPSPFFVSSSVSSYRRLVSRLVLLVEGRGVVVLVVSLLRRHRPCPRCPHIARASRHACRGAKRMPWLVSWAYSSCGCGALSFSSRPPSRACLSKGGAAFVSVLWIDLFVYITCPCRGIL